jgi:hypothetical protein
MEVGLCSQLAAVEISYFACMLYWILSRKQEEGKLMLHPETAVPHLSQDRRVFGAFCEVHFTCHLTWWNEKGKASLVCYFPQRYYWSLTTRKWQTNPNWVALCYTTGQ